MRKTSWLMGLKHAVDFSLQLWKRSWPALVRAKTHRDIVSVPVISQMWYSHWQGTKWKIVSAFKDKKPLSCVLCWLLWRLGVLHCNIHNRICSMDTACNLFHHYWIFICVLLWFSIWTFLARGAVLCTLVPFIHLTRGTRNMWSMNSYPNLKTFETNDVGTRALFLLFVCDAVIIPCCTLLCVTSLESHASLNAWKVHE